jgi:hypothetical protein
MKTETEMVYPLDKNQAISAVSTLRFATAQRGVASFSRFIPDPEDGSGDRSSTAI